MNLIKTYEKTVMFVMSYPPNDMPTAASGASGYLE